MCASNFVNLYECVSECVCMCVHIMLIHASVCECWHACDKCMLMGMN